MAGFDYSFDPHPLVRGPIAQTIIGSLFTSKPELPRRAQHRIRLDEKNLLMMYELKAAEETAPVVLIGHGMGGCSESVYMRRIAVKLFQEGFGVFMMNHRGSGRGIGLCDRLWNGGSSEDLARMIQFIVDLHPARKLLVMGFSLTGNILLKYLGEGRQIPSNVHSALAVNPPLDLEVASRQISEGPWSNTFNKYYLKLMNRQVEAMVECHPDAFRPAATPNTIWEFDVEYTAPAFGYPRVEAYYEECSAKQFLEPIAVPTTILCSQDDPFIPPEIFQSARMSQQIDFINPEFGGHMGYISRSRNSWGDRRWMDFICVQWAKTLYPK
ncbi:MAG: alpha/beta fold hydrolase [Nitrospinaceae bacterium]